MALKGPRQDFDHIHDLFPRADRRTDAFVQPYSPEVNVPGPPSPYYTDINQYVGLHQQESGNDLEATTAEEARKERCEAQLDRLPADYAFDHDPYWGQLRSVNEAGGLWSTGFDPSVGPTLGRAGPYIPLYPEPLPPELFKPEKSTIDYNAMYGRPTPEHIDPGGIYIGNIARNHLLPDEQSWKKTDEGQVYASGDELVNRYCQLTSGFRPWRFTPQGNVPIEYPHGGGDKAHHRASAEQIARFHYYDVPEEKLAVRDWSRAPEANTDPAQRELVREEVVMHEMRDVLSVEYGGIPRFSYGAESKRPKHDLESVSKTASIYSPVDHAKIERITQHAHPPREGVVSLWHDDNEDVNFQLMGAPSPRVPATSDRRIAGEKTGPTGRELIATTAYQHHPGSHNTARITRRALQNILLPLNSSKHDVRADRIGSATGLSNTGGAARNTILPYVNPKKETGREHALYGYYQGGGSKTTRGIPALYSAELVERPGDVIKAIPAQDGLSRPGHGYRMLGTAGDQDVNPHDIWSVNNRTSYEEELAHSGGAKMTQFAPLEQQKQEYSRKAFLREATQISGAPDPSLLSAFHGNPFVPVSVHS